MKLRYSFAFILFFSVLRCFAQDDYFVSGFIADSFTHENIDSVMVRFLSRDSVECYNFMSTKDKYANFYAEMKPGSYIMHCSKKGYADVYKNVVFRYRKYRITSGSIGKILMSKRATFNDRQLSEAVVTATRIKMVMKGDTIVYNADAFQLSEGSMLDRLVTMLPGMELKKGGEMFVNGKKVNSLLVNGEDFFRGNPRVALENLPAYMVDKVKVYERGAEWEDMVARKNDLYGGDEKPLVVDVNLKRQYSVGWIANASLGGGTDEHYAARGFALRFTPQSRLAFMGYSNDVYGNSYYDANGNWQEPGGGANMKTHELTSDLLVKDRRQRYKVNNTLTFKSVRNVSDEYQSSVSYLDENNVYGMRSNRSIDRHWSVRDQAKMIFTPDKESVFIFQPDIYYNNYRNTGFSRSAEFDRQLSEHYMGEALDSLFFEGSSEQYRRNLLSSLRQVQRGDGYHWYVNGAFSGNMAVSENDVINFALSGKYHYTHNHNLFDAAAVDNNNRQVRFSDSPNKGYSYSADANYRYLLDLKKIILTIVPKYRFSQEFRSSNRSYYKLENTDWEDNSLDYLASAKDEIYCSMDMGNSVCSDSWKDEHLFAADVEFFFKGRNYRKNRYVTVSFPLRVMTNKLDYQRGDIDTLFHNTYNFFDPNVQYRYDFNNGTDREVHFKVRYSLSSSEPSSEYLTGYRDSSTPLIVRVGNRFLKNTYKHEAETSFSQNIYRGKTSYFSFLARYMLWENMLCQSMSYDASTGVRIYHPDNIDGNWGVHSQMLWRSVFDKNKRINYMVETNFDYRHSVDYAELLQTMSSGRSSVNRFVTRQNFNVSYTYNYYSLSADVSGEWTHSTSNRFNRLDAFNISYGLSGGMPLPGKFQISTNLRMYSRYGYSNDQFNTKQLIWSARLSRSFFRGLMNVELEAFDLLNKMSSYSYGINAQMQTETYRNVLRRYVMLNLTFRLNKEPKKRMR